MSGPTSFREVIELWETRDEMAAELRFTPGGVSKWWQRNAIPSEWWGAVVSTPRARDAGVNGLLLMRFAGEKRATPEPAEARA